MNEPTVQVTDKDVLAMLGAAHVELNILRSQVAALQQRVKELTPEPAKAE